MPKKLSLRSIKDRESLHPKSRKVHQLTRALGRSTKIQGKKADRARTSAHPLVDLLTWFQMRFEENRQRCESAEEMAELVEEYLARHDPEIDSIKNDLRPNRPAPVKLDMLQAVRAKEWREYETAGITVPDLQSAENVRKLREWNGSYDGIHGRIRLLFFKQKK